MYCTVCFTVVKDLHYSAHTKMVHGHKRPFSKETFGDPKMEEVIDNDGSYAAIEYILRTSHSRFNLPPLLPVAPAGPVCGRYSRHPYSGSSLNFLGSCR